MNKTASIIIAIGLVVGIGFILSSNKNVEDTANIEPAQQIYIKDGVQYIPIKAKGGYTPRTSIAKADMPTKLVMKTDSTFDCSSSLVIRSLNYQQILPNTGETIIDLGSPKSGEKLLGLCSMGMYSFEIDFQA